MFLHFWDTRTEETIVEIEDAESAPRKGDAVCFAYNEALDTGMWEVKAVTWNYFAPALETEPYADVELTPYEGEDWSGTADAQLTYQEKSTAIPTKESKAD